MLTGDKLLAKVKEISTQQQLTRQEMTIKTTELLELFSKATQLDLSYEVMEDSNGGYKIRFFEFYKTNFTETLFINESTKCNTWTYEKCSASFDYLMNTFVSMLEQKEKEKLKEQKLQELLARLTDEEKSLLGVK